MQRYKWTHRLALLAIAASLFCITSVQAKKPAQPGGGGGGGSAPTYEVVPLDDLGGFFVESIAYDVNNDRVIVGAAYNEMGRFTAYWTLTESANGVQTALVPLPSSAFQNSVAYGINDHDEVVGLADTETTRIGVYWPSPGEEPFPLPPLPGDNFTDALQINADGVIGGHSYQVVTNPDGSHTYSSGAAVLWQAFRLQDGAPAVSDPVELPIPSGATSVSVLAINDLDESGLFETVGQSRSADGTQSAVRWTVASTEAGLIPAPSALVLDTKAVAYGINNQGDVSGIRQMFNIWEGAVWSDEQTYTLDRAKFISRARGRDINNSGVVVGEGDYSKRGIFYNFQAAVWPSPDADMILLDRFLTPNSPFYVLTNAYAVNDEGEVVGYGWTGDRQAYIAIGR